MASQATAASNHDLKDTPLGDLLPDDPRGTEVLVRFAAVHSQNEDLRGQVNGLRRRLAAFNLLLLPALLL